jgi:hypothetical protein
MHAYFTSALNGGEWPPSRFGLFYHCVHCIRGWVGTRTSLDAVARRIIPALARNRTPVGQPEASHFKLWNFVIYRLFHIEKCLLFKIIFPFILFIHNVFVYVYSLSHSLITRNMGMKCSLKEN